MALFKVKFKPSHNDRNEGRLYYQVIHKRAVRQICTQHKIFSYEWDAWTETLIMPRHDEERAGTLLTMEGKIMKEKSRLRKIILSFKDSGIEYTCDDIVASFNKQMRERSFFDFMGEIILNQEICGRSGIHQSYTSTLRSFMRYRANEDIMIDEISPNVIIRYESYLKRRGVSMNTVSFYMRILRAVYNRAVEEGLTAQRQPFKHVYTGIGKTIKRAIPLCVIRKIKRLDLSSAPSLDFARDMFLFSFYTRGMSFVDMAYLEKKNLRNGTLFYRRRKTGQILFIKWEKCMSDIVEKHNGRTYGNYMLPIINMPFKNDRDKYKSRLAMINRRLKRIAAMVGLKENLTMYVARHSWASIARSRNIPISVICEGMGHSSETTTRIYLASLDSSDVDNANKMILEMV